MLRRFSKKKNSSDGSEENAKKYKKLLSKFLDFITSSIWSIPISSFIESQSVVFDRQQMETEIYIEIHKEFSELIDTLIECFCQDVGTTATELVEAIRLFDQKDISQKYKVALEPLLAAQNFNVFVPMMMRKNIELQLQALQMIEFMCGLIPSVLQLEDGETLRHMKKLTPEETERYVLISVLRHSKDEYDAMQKGNEEMELMARNSRIQREALEQDIRREESLLQRALAEGLRNNQAASSQTDAPLSVAAVMASHFSIDTGTSTDDISFEIIEKPNNSSSNTASETMTSREARPKSAKRAGSAARKNSRSNQTTTTATTESATETEEPTPPVNATPGSRPNTAKRSTSAVRRSVAVNQTELEDNFKITEVKSKEPRPTTAKGPNERKYSKAGLEDLVGVKFPTSDNQKKDDHEKGTDENNALQTDEIDPKKTNDVKDSKNGSRPSSRKSVRNDDESTNTTTTTTIRPTSRKEPRAKTPSAKNDEDRVTNRRASLEPSNSKKAETSTRQRRASSSQKEKEGERKPPKPIAPLRKSKIDGEVVFGRPESPGMDHGPRRKNLNDVNSHLVDPNRLNSSDVRQRAQYLREQRDKLLQMKNEERIKQLNDIQKSSMERPKTAQAARKVLDKKESDTIRKEISNKLKTQILSLE